MSVFVLAALDQETPQNPAPAGDATTAPSAGSEQQTPPAAGQGGGLPIWTIYPVIIAIFYFLMIAPERKQRKKREAMLAAVKKGDKVITTGGMFASVAAVNEDSITLQASDDVRLKFSRASIAQVLEVDGGDASAKS
jgi:preprotein translocase subunit YajC